MMYEDQTSLFVNPSRLVLISLNLQNSYLGTFSLCDKLNCSSSIYICCLSEFNRDAILHVNPRKYFCFINHRVALLVHRQLDSRSSIVDKKTEYVDAFVKTSDFKFYVGSIYLSPSLSLLELKRALFKVHQFISSRALTNVIIAEDFNAEHSSWSNSVLISYVKKAKGQVVHDIFSQIHLFPISVPNSHNFTRINASGCVS